MSHGNLKTILISILVLKIHLAYFAVGYAISGKVQQLMKPASLISRTEIAIGQFCDPAVEWIIHINNYSSDPKCVCTKHIACKHTTLEAFIVSGLTEYKAGQCLTWSVNIKSKGCKVRFPGRIVVEGIKGHATCPHGV